MIGTRFVNIIRYWKKIEKYPKTLSINFFWHLLCTEISEIDILQYLLSLYLPSSTWINYLLWQYSIPSQAGTSMILHSEWQKSPIFLKFWVKSGFYEKLPLGALPLAIPVQPLPGSPLNRFMPSTAAIWNIFKICFTCVKLSFCISDRNSFIYTPNLYNIVCGCLYKRAMKLNQR